MASNELKHEMLLFPKIPVNIYGDICVDYLLSHPFDIIFLSNACFSFKYQNFKGDHIKLVYCIISYRPNVYTICLFIVKASGTMQQ